jgi:ATP-binding cassette subfamily F protein 3
MANLLQLKNGKKSYGPRSLFDEASFSIDADEKVGVIGPNGAGKSTLFRILIGEEALDSGDITKASGLRIGYLAQEDKWEGDETVEGFLSSQDFTPIWDLKAMAPAFGLTLDHFEKPIRSLSGGYRMRVKLLYLVASQPDLMMLDEPTNYLDLETLVVLENFLQSTSSAFLLISHDREFLRRTTDHVLEIEAGQMTKYAGQIDDYFEQKELMREQLEKAAMSVQAKRKEILDFAAKFGAKATKARQVQSRLKALDRIESIEVRDLPTTAKIRLPEPVRTGKVVIELKDVILGYGDRTILKNLNLGLGKGDHLGVVGVNGAGKSTLLKSLAGELEPRQGSIEFGLNVEVAYFAQHVAERLKGDDTVLEAMGEFAHSDVKRQEILDLAGCLLFSGDDVHKKIRVLSGGEKSRVALGQILLKRASCLLLDEPTNHLDFHTVEALTQALAAYSGTVVIVSHDRGFVRRTASKILEIQNGQAEFYPGSYDEYVWSVQKGVLSQREAAEVSQKASGKSGGGDQAPKFNFKEVKKQLEKDVRASEKEMTSLEKQTETLRKEMLALNEKLTQASGAQAASVAREIAEKQNAIDGFEMKYLELLERHDLATKELEDLSLAGSDNRRT